MIERQEIVVFYMETGGGSYWHCLMPISHYHIREWMEDQWPGIRLDSCHVTDVSCKQLHLRAYYDFEDQSDFLKMFSRWHADMRLEVVALVEMLK